MIKIPVYIRVAKNVSKKKGTPPFRVSASPLPKGEPIYKTYDYYSRKPKQPLITVEFGISLNLPDNAFEKASEIIAEIDFRTEDIKIACKVPRGVKVEIKKHALKQLQK